MKLETVALGSISPDPANTRKHSRRNLDAIKASLRRFGQQKPIVVDAKGIVLAGNGTLAAAQELGWKEIQIVRTDLAGTQATAFGIADNRSAELAEWDEKLGDVLASLKAEDFPLEEIGFDAADLEELAPEAAGKDVDAEPQIDKAEELRAKWGVELGQVWQLGEHRLLCGDSTSKDHINKLLHGEKAEMMFTDPPYGVDYGGGTLGNRKKLENDHDAEIYFNFLPNVLSHVDGPCYMWFASRKICDVAKALEKTNCEIHEIIIWHKTNATYGALNAQYKVRYEPCFYFKPKGSTLRWIGKSDEPNLWEMKKDGINKLHPTQKPVDVVARALLNHDAKIVLEPFSGSGSTLIACEQTNRKCRAIEISPAYVAVAIQRWADATGKEPRKL